MKINQLTLFTNKLDLEKEFYSEKLGFEIIHENKNTFTIKVGWSKLTFKYSEFDHLYHYCFLIPRNKLSEALDWMKNRVQIIEIEKVKKIQWFEDWNVNSFYFYDASGNIAEFIVRHDLEYESDSEFKVSDILCLNEIGLPVSNIGELNRALEQNLKTTFYKGDLKRFGTNGDAEGMFLMPNYKVKDIWFPTQKKIEPNPFEAIIENNGVLNYMEFTNGKVSFKELSKN